MGKIKRTKKTKTKIKKINNKKIKEKKQIEHSINIKKENRRYTKGIKKKEKIHI